MRVRIFRDWSTSYPCDYDYKDMKIVNDDSYEYAILFNTPRPKLKVPKENVLGLAWEPKSLRKYKPYYQYAKDNIGMYVVGDSTGFQLPFCENQTFMYDYRISPPSLAATHPMSRIDSSLSKETQKVHPICMVASEKKSLVGHKKRHSLISKILKTDLDVHIYGKGINDVYKDPRIKGGFSLHCDVYPKYYFDITIENVREGSFVTEKIFNPLVHRTCPIYWGSNKISSYCNDFYYSLPDNDDDCIEFLKKVSANYLDMYQAKKAQIEKSRAAAIEYNYLDFAYNYFKTGKLDSKKI